MLKRSTLPSIGLFGVFAIAGAGFWQFNNAALRDHGELEARGISVSGHIEHARISHKSCNSSIDVSYVDAAHHRWEQRFQACRAPVIGETVVLKYLPDAPPTAMLSLGDSPYDEAMLDRGRWIGGIVGIFGLIMALKYASQYRRALWDAPFVQFI